MRTTSRSFVKLMRLGISCMLESGRCFTGNYFGGWTGSGDPRCELLPIRRMRAFAGHIGAEANLRGIVGLRHHLVSFGEISVAFRFGLGGEMTGHTDQ